MFLETVYCAKHAWFTVLTCSVSTKEEKKKTSCMWSVQISDKNGWKCSTYSCDIYIYIVLRMITLQNSIPEGNAKWEIHIKTPAGLKTWNVVLLAIFVWQKRFILNLNLSFLECSHPGSLSTTEKHAVSLPHVRPESCPTKEQASQSMWSSLTGQFCDKSAESFLWLLGEGVFLESKIFTFTPVFHFICQVTAALKMWNWRGWVLPSK